MAGRGNIDVLARCDSALLVERQQNSAAHCIGVLTQNEVAQADRRFNHEPEGAPDEFAIEQAAAGCVFVFEVECQLAARWSDG